MFFQENEWESTPALEIDSLGADSGPNSSYLWDLGEGIYTLRALGFHLYNGENNNAYLLCCCCEDWIRTFLTGT